jgi:hypothetical protein
MIGMARLGVWIDVWLIAAAAAAVAASFRMRRAPTSEPVLPAPPARGSSREFSAERAKCRRQRRSAAAETGPNHGGRHGTAVAPVRVNVI